MAPGSFGAFLKRCARNMEMRLAISPCTGAVNSTGRSEIGCVKARYVACSACRSIT